MVILNTEGKEDNGFIPVIHFAPALHTVEVIVVLWSSLWQLLLVSWLTFADFAFMQLSVGLSENDRV